MKPRLVFRLLLLLALLVVFIFNGRQLAGAQSGSGASTALSTSYDLTWNTIDNGGGESVGIGYALMSTIGQPDAGPMSGGSYQLNGGFWGGAMNPYQVYLPVVIK